MRKPVSLADQQYFFQATGCQIKEKSTKWLEKKNNN